MREEVHGGGRGEGVYVDIGGEGNEELETAHVGGGWWWGGEGRTISTDTDQQSMRGATRGNDINPNTGLI